MQTYVPMVRGDLISWFLGAADREGVYNPPDDTFPPLQEGDRVLGRVSPEAMKLFACLNAVVQVVREKAELVDANDSVKFRNEFIEEFNTVIKPALDLFKELATIQMAREVKPYHEVDGERFAIATVFSGGVIVGFKTPEELQTRLAGLIGHGEEC